MAEKKKMSVAEILAAARKADAGGGAPKSSSPPTESAEAPSAETPPVEQAETTAEAAAGTPVEKPAPAASSSGGKRPSVAEIMAAARAKGAAAEKPAAAKPAAKPAAKESPKPAAAKAPAEPEAPPREKETSSILAAARSADKPGPMSKAEAAKLKPSAAKPEREKAKLAAPPMPVKPDYAKPKPKKDEAADGEDRRFFLAVLVGSFLAVGFTAMTATFSLWTLGLARFMFPNILTEPPSRFKVGFPGEFPPGSVEEKYKALFGVWVVNTEYEGARQIFALRTVCTHLGCTPNWLDAEQKFKCPCHGSGFYKDGINFEGPAPRPLERYAIRLADDGQLEVDKSKLFLEEKGQWRDPASFVPA